MGAIPYLVLLAIFALVLYWFARRSETDKDASKGILGIGRDQDREPELDELSPRERVRRLSGRDKD
ncbi:hypothetical protein [Parvularcula marina]|uniref:Uncharacterized protein n=1 Tax=Parvularcula marina TaxID=2292771 RepID=A0A371RJ07_9PROT|nr:hypothetical protein [Parvularcula marina]RFB05436.1 hypothetical protein DX908_09305 [Parvularcula marina]